MKKISVFILIGFLAVISSCSKDPVVVNDKKVGISSVTYYPDIVLTDGDIVSVVQNTTFTDPGVKATAGGADIPVITSGTVDVSTVGIYTLSYKATNADGFFSTSTRTVVVIPAEELPGVDLSGSYKTTGANPAPGALFANISKVAPGVYYTTNCWGGGSSAIIPAYFICTDGETPIVPLQESPAGLIESTGPGTYVGGLITWEIDRLEFGGGPLILVKTWQKQ